MKDGISRKPVDEEGRITGDYHDAAIVQFYLWVHKRQGSLAAQRKYFAARIPYFVTTGEALIIAHIQHQHCG